MGDHTATCAARCTKDHRSTAEKLRDVANHPRTPPNEAEAARNRLRAMGKPLEAPAAPPKMPWSFTSPRTYAAYYDPFGEAVRAANEADARRRREREDLERAREARMRKYADDASERARRTAFEAAALRKQAEAEKFRRFEAEMFSSFKEGFEAEMGRPSTWDAYRPGETAEEWAARVKRGQTYEANQARAQEAIERFEARQREKDARDAARDESAQMRDRMRDEMHEARTSASAAAKAAQEDARLRRDKGIEDQLKYDGVRVEYDESGNPIGVRNIRRNTFEHSFGTNLGGLPKEWFE